MPQDLIPSAVIKFNIHATPEEIVEYEQDILFGVYVSDPAIEHLVDPDEIVLPASGFQLIIDYPLTRKAIISIPASDQPRTRTELLLLICSAYQRVYEEEGDIAPITGMANRRRTNGKYGIYGHYIEDLSLMDAMVQTNADGVMEITLTVES